MEDWQRQAIEAAVEKTFEVYQPLDKDRIKREAVSRLRVADDGRIVGAEDESATAESVVAAMETSNELGWLFFSSPQKRQEAREFDERIDKMGKTIEGFKQHYNKVSHPGPDPKPGPTKHELIQQGIDEWEIQMQERIPPEEKMKIVRRVEESLKKAPATSPQAKQAMADVEAKIGRPLTRVERSQYARRDYSRKPDPILTQQADPTWLPQDRIAFARRKDAAIQKAKAIADKEAALGRPLTEVEWMQFDNR